MRSKEKERLYDLYDSEIEEKMRNIFESNFPDLKAIAQNLRDEYYIEKYNHKTILYSKNIDLKKAKKLGICGDLSYDLSFLEEEKQIPFVPGEIVLSDINICSFDISELSNHSIGKKEKAVPSRLIILNIPLVDARRRDELLNMEPTNACCYLGNGNSVGGTVEMVGIYNNEKIIPKETFLEIEYGDIYKSPIDEIYLKDEFLSYISEMVRLGIDWKKIYDFVVNISQNKMDTLRIHEVNPDITRWCTEFIEKETS